MAVLLFGLLHMVWRQTTGHPVINEVVAANRTSLADEDGHASDWLEIYNPGPRPINLAGWSLTDDPNQPQKWTFPDITLAGQDYLLVFASGKDRKPAEPEAELHANFKLRQSGEFLGLYNVLDNRFVDTLTLPAEPRLSDVAYGRYVDPQNQTTAYGYLTPPTPGQPNESTPAWSGLVAPLNFSHQRDFYQNPFTLALTTTTPGATIRYTLDGSTPTDTHGTLYAGPFSITATTLVRAAAYKPDYRPSPVETHSYIFFNDVPAQPQNPPGFPTIWGGYEGSPVTADYEMDSDIINHPRYGEAIKASLKSLPSLSLVTDKQSFHDLYANPRRRGRAWERLVSVELIDPAGNRPNFQIDAGIRMQGELGRSEYMPKHAFRLFFRDEYGAGKLNYPLFPDSPVTEFDSLVLRSGVNRSYAGYPKRPEEIKLTTYTRDQWLRESQLALSGFGARGIFVHLYLNGLYWGVYNVVERPDDAFMASYFGGTEDEWDTISHEETVTTPNEPFNTLHQLAAEGKLEAPDRYEAVKNLLDVPHFADYLILNWYAGNLDWGFNNWYAGVRTSAGPVRYFVWDGERTWFEGAEIYMKLDEYLDRPNLVKPLLNALLENPDFRMELADRMYRHLFNKGELSDVKAQARWQQLNDLIEPAIIAESARWGDVRFEQPLTQKDWFAARDDVLAQMEGNAARLITLAREAGYYPDSDPPQFKPRGGPVEAGFELSLTGAPDGIIYYTTDGTDPRQPVTGQVSPSANSYRQPLVLTKSVHIKTRLFKDGAWSALNEATFDIGSPSSGRLQMTEIMYNPPGGDAYEFVELKNMGNAAMKLAGASFQGITFTFPADTPPLAAGEFVVLVRNPAAFAERYPGVPVTGVYDKQLANNGERLILHDSAGQTLAEVVYNDGNGWPISPDGWGDSLVLIDASGDPNDPTNWRASAYLNGSPGADDPADDPAVSPAANQIYRAN